MPKLREALLVTAIAVLAIGSLVVFAAMDRRSPNDHDTYFTGGSIPALEALLAPDADASAVLIDHFLTGGPHPRLPQTVLLAASSGGPTRFAYRMANLPFVLMLVLGTWLLGRQLGGPRVGLGAVALVCSLPLMVNHSHKFIANWHAAALTPMAWALLLIALKGRGRAAWAAAVGAGLVQAARCYCHPVVLPDVAASTALVCGVAAWGAWRGRTVEHAQPLLRVGAASALALAGTGHILGWTTRWLEEPGYSLANYRAGKTDVVGRWTWAEASELPAAAARYVAEMWNWQLFPTGFVLLVAGLIGVAMAARRGRAPVGVLLLLGAFVLQAPLAVLTFARGTFTADWTVLLPGLCAAAAWGALADPSELSGRLRQGWLALLGVQAAFVLATPLALGGAAPSPLENPAWWSRGVPAMFAQSSTGTVWNTHHIPLRGDVAGEPLAHAIAAMNVPGFETAELRYRGADLSEPCRPAPADDGAWVWGAGDDQTAQRVWSPWPAVFTRVHPLRADSAPPNVLDAVRDQPPSPTGAMVRHLKTQDRPVVLRLWIDLTSDEAAAFEACQPSWADDALAATAREWATSMGLSIELELQDFGGELVGLENEYDRDPRYLSRALLLR
ncbi:MAG: hypothetical protein GY898_06265 [Proteobacteria bacterium]|nr:hypothetical protein [Pseudomonadota bacterium]